MWLKYNIMLQAALKRLVSRNKDIARASLTKFLFPVCSMGNPHATFFVADCEAIPLPDIGHGLEHHEFFPERCNVSVVTVCAFHFPDALVQAFTEAQMAASGIMWFCRLEIIGPGSVFES
jgi:diaminopimelate epimerase